MRTAKIVILVIICACAASAFTCNGGTGPQPTPEPKPTATPVSTVEPTATATGEPVPTPTPTPTTVMGYVPDIRIINIVYKGDPDCNECNEYVVIKSYEGRSFNLFGWELVDITDGSPTFTFPHFVIDRFHYARIYTDYNHPDTGGLSFGSPDPIWNNTHPDMAALYNNRGELVSNKSYDIY